jgi:hypothetical protein
MSNVLEAALAQYEKNTQPSTSAQKISSEERLKMYFAAILPKGQTSGMKRIRILPPAEGQQLFWTEKYFHEVQVDKKWVKLYDPAQDGERSPLNDVGDALRMTGSEADKKLAGQYRARKFYILRVIDRDNEQDGVKFWRIKHSLKNDGAYNKIMDLMKAKKEDITDPEVGRDVTLTLTVVKNPMGGEYTAITSVIPEDKSPLSENAEQKTAWLGNTLTWQDAYPKKAIEYLQGVSEGYVPKWNDKIKKWVYGEEAEAMLGGAPVSNVELPDPQEDDEADENLPF